ncbi:MAG TPA: hypothetical protein VFN09_08380 [Rhodanobacteraceae bacterium]|nr:hypothetical protein [Rhodanobacteraceae bacterium]
MTARNWRVWRPASLQEAVEGCVQFAASKRVNVERLADLVGESKWTIYKWMESGNIPARKIAGLEHACGRAYITDYLAASASKIVIDIPTGRGPAQHDIHALQAACTAAVGAVLEFAAGRKSAPETCDYLTTAIGHLAQERAHIETHHQPELDLQ